MPYVISEFPLTDSEAQLASKFFIAMCLYLGTKLLAATAYHPQTNGKTLRYNKTITTRLLHLENKHQDDLDAYVEQLTYAYNSQRTPLDEYEYICFVKL